MFMGWVMQWQRGGYYYHTLGSTYFRHQKVTPVSCLNDNSPSWQEYFRQVLNPMHGQILVSSDTGGIRYEETDFVWGNQKFLMVWCYHQFLRVFSGTCTGRQPPGEDLMFAKALDDKEEDQSGGRSRQKPFLDKGGCLKVFPAKFI